MTTGRKKDTIMTMKKIIVLILCIIFFTPATFGEDFPPRGGRDEYPIYWYLHRHGEKLKKVLESKKFFRLHGWGASYIVKIHPNGQVEPLELFESQNKYYDKKVKEIIESVPAEEFGDEIKSEYLIVRVCMNFSDLSDVAYVSYRTQEPYANIYVIRVSTTK